MVHDLDLAGQLAAIGLGLILAYIGGRLLIAPTSLSRDSIMYRYMVYRLGLFRRTSAEPEHLSLRQIRRYGASVLVLAVISIAIGLL